MPDEKQYIAVDLGAESGRVMLGLVSGDKLVLEEVYRFGNGPVEEDGALRWDFEKLFSEVKTGIAKAAAQAKVKVAGIGVDTWGAGLGLIDAEGRLIENPYHYRDSRTQQMIEKAFEFMPKRDIYEHTGIQFMPFNDIYNLLEMRLNNSKALAKAKHALTMADLFSYHLCGRMYSEYTLASTSQLVNMKTGRWEKQIFDKLSLPLEIMPEIVRAGTVVGKLTKTIAKEIGCGQIPVIAVASHDTGSAVAAVPAEKNNWAFSSSGTWSLIGMEVPQAVINDKTFDYQFTNEGGVEDTIRLLKNVMGLWIVQECKRQWQKEGADFSYDDLTRMAEKASPFAGHINPDCTDFYPPGDMPARINDYLARTGQKQLEDKGQIVRVVLESLALRYRWVIDKVEEVTGTDIDCLHVVGGGSKNELLNQFTANAVGKKVVTGPVEATATGNILMQAKATGQIKSLTDIRRIVRNSFELTEYPPRDTTLWNERYKEIESLL